MIAETSFPLSSGKILNQPKLPKDETWSWASKCTWFVLLKIDHQVLAKLYFGHKIFLLLHLHRAPKHKKILEKSIPFLRARWRLPYIPHNTSTKPSKPSLPPPLKNPTVAAERLLVSPRHRHLSLSHSQPLSLFLFLFFDSFFPGLLGYVWLVRLY